MQADQIVSLGDGGVYGHQAFWSVEEKVNNSEKGWVVLW